MEFFTKPNKYLTMTTTTITVEAVNVKDKKTFTYKQGARKGQQGFLYPVGINSGGKWINGTAFSEEEADIFRNLKKGDRIILVLYEEEYQGKKYEKFKLPNDKDQMKTTLESLSARVKTLEDALRSIVEANKLVYIKPKAQGQLNGDLAQHEIDSRFDINPPDSDLPF